MKPINRHIFGPVPSRRLGLSLGIDLVPFKTCSYDCIYCQVGKTTLKTIECKEFFSVKEIITELKQRLVYVNPDIITFSGSGEPTLYSKLDILIEEIRKITNIKIALLTNGSLLWKKDVRKKVLEADIILPTLTTTFNYTFKKIHRPHPNLNINMIIEGLIKLRKEYKKNIYLELFFISNINDSEKELLALKNIIDKISPDKVQINTVVRPPSEKGVTALDINKLEYIKDLLAQDAEIIAEKSRTVNDFGKKADHMSQIFEMIKRRPVREIDIVKSLGIDLNEVKSIIKGLLIKGMISKYEHLGEIYYKGRVGYE